MLCRMCRYYKGLTDKGKVRCRERGTKRPRTTKCIEFDMATCLDCCEMEKGNCWMMPGTWRSKNPACEIWKPKEGC